MSGEQDKIGLEWFGWVFPEIRASVGGDRHWGVTSFAARCRLWPPNSDHKRQSTGRTQAKLAHDIISTPLNTLKKISSAYDHWFLRCAPVCLTKAALGEKVPSTPGIPCTKGVQFLSTHTTRTKGAQFLSTHATRTKGVQFLSTHATRTNGAQFLSTRRSVQKACNSRVHIPPVQKERNSWVPVTPYKRRVTRTSTKWYQHTHRYLWHDWYPAHPIGTYGTIGTQHTPHRYIWHDWYPAHTPSVLVARLVPHEGPLRVPGSVLVLPRGSKRLVNVF